MTTLPIELIDPLYDLHCSPRWFLYTCSLPWREGKRKRDAVEELARVRTIPENNHQKENNEQGRISQAAR